LSLSRLGVADKHQTGGPAPTIGDVDCSFDSSQAGITNILAALVTSAARLEALLNDGVSWDSSLGGTWEDRHVDVLLAFVVDGVRASGVCGMAIAGCSVEN